MKKNRIKVAVPFLLLLIVGITSCAGFREYKRKVADISIYMADFSAVPDGKYYGEYDAVLVVVKVDVTVKDKKITDINLIEHKNDRGAKAESIIPKIISEQTLLVDTVSGATNSSRVIQKAIQNALESTKNKL